MKLGQYVYFHGILENSEIHSKLAILDKIWASEGPNTGQIWCKITFFAIASSIMVILSGNSVSTCISMAKIRKIRDSFKLGYFGNNIGQRRSKYRKNLAKIILCQQLHQLG